MHPFAAATAPSLVLLLLLLFSLSTTQYSVADANYNEISPISTDSHINQVIFDPDHHNSSSLPLLIHNSKNEDGGKTYEFNITARKKFKYFMELQLVLKDHKDVVNGYGGTPDTGSDLIWLNLTCQTTAAAAADACIEIKKPEEPFKCRSRKCQDMTSDIGMKDDKCKESTEVCRFNISYMDNSTYEGYFGEGRFRFGDGDDREFWMKYGVSRGTVPKKNISKGVVGLGRGKLSLFKQLINNAAVDQFKFSYCLPQYEKKVDSNKKAQYATGKLVFGSQVNTNPHNFTQLLNEHAGDQYCRNRYCVNLTSIYVKGRDKEGKNITVKDTRTTEVMVIDSGSTFTFLRGELFKSFVTLVKQEIGTCACGVTPKPYGCCFEKGSAEKLEKVSLGFNGTTVELEQKNFFDLKKDEGKDYLCLTVKKKEDYVVPKVHILGSRAQMDFKVAFDVANKMVSFDNKEPCNQEKKKKNSNDGVE